MNSRVGVQALRWVLVTVGIVALTSVSIDATVNFRGSQSALATLTDRAFAPECQTGTMPVPVGDTVWCVDQFPVVPGASCPHKITRSPADTTANIAAEACQPVVAEGSIPWLYVAQHHAVQICAKAGKRLLPPDVWYEAALGTPDDGTCHVAGNSARPNQKSTCVSGYGLYDMVGNVWEWVDAEVVQGQLEQTTPVPETGYVQAVSRSGWPTATAATTSQMFAADYVWSKSSGVQGVMRGGFYRAKTDAGIYAIHAGIAPSFASNATGVRCGYRLSS